ncbi:50S ribosomal protein L35 [Ruminococcus albus]|jgi:large subunit ribosomal protein L35|uniref:Large ribosomal subunit protein bL35 n=1 Tax=Ruminococcus albus SY3 TaxID=1341156 RepID=A0A011WQS0_RUMAL|nr:50S ribosomal protein L35 [Ruminococcus albus]EXM39360.1 50S ribosomal protein L35 [Ruminococcus albus SY3]MBE6868427.1 50S ribosomal protein L35 [Ruminococcus albus]
MPKIKTHSGAKKRFKVTGTGKVKFQHVNKRHRLNQKDHKRKRILRNAAYADDTNIANVKALIPYKK